MKQISRILLFFAGLFAFVACQQDNSFNSEGVRITLNTDQPVARTLIEADGDGTYTAKWHNGDVLGVFTDTPSSELGKSDCFEFTNTAAEGTVGSFTAELNDVSGAITLYSFYPRSQFETNYNDGNTGLTVKQIQNPTLTSFDPTTDILVGQPKNVTIAGNEVTVNNLKFTRVMAIVKIVLKDATTGDKLSADVVNSVKMETTNTALTGRAKVNLQTGEFVSIINGATTKFNDVEAKYTPSQNFTINDSNAAYVVVNPNGIANGETITFTIDTDKNTIAKTVSLTEDMNFKAGHVTTITLNIKDSEVTPKTNMTYFEKVTTAPANWEGEYLLAYAPAGEDTYYIATNAASNQFATVAVTAVDGKIEKEKGVSFIMTLVKDAGTDKYYIKLPNGKIVKNSSGSYISAVGNIGEETSQWAISCNAGEVTFVSNSGYHLKWDKGNGVLKLYKSSNTNNPLPSLFKLNE